MTTRHPLNGARCPGCGLESLDRTEHGVIACSRPSCPAPDAAQRVLAEATPDHVVDIRSSDFAIEHPLVERLDGVLLDVCPFGEWLSSRPGPPVSPGRYRVRRTTNPTPWVFERVVDEPGDDGRVPHAPDAAERAADREDVSA